MVSARNISAEKIMNKNPVTAENDKSLGSIKDTMEEKELRAILVVDSNGGLEGVIGYRDLIRFIQFNPERTKLGKVMHQPPEFDTGESLVELCDLRINSGRKLLVHTSGDKLEGVIGDQEFLEAFKDTEELGSLNTKDIHTQELINVFEQDSLEEARHTMLDSNISRLPVLDKNGKLTGIIHSTDLLNTMVSRQSPDAGGTSGGRSGSNEVNIAGGNEKETMSKIPVSELMRRNFYTSDEHFRGDKAVQNMIENDIHEIIFMEDGYPQSIVTAKDFIEFIAELAPGNTVLVTITGLDVSEEKAAVHNKIRTQLQGSLGRKLERPQELKLVVKKADKDGKKHRYDIDLRLDSEYGLIKIDEEGWELLDVVDEALSELNTVVRKKKEKRTEH
jgi:CBS domain-containing protein